MVDYNTKFTGQFIKSEAGQSLYDPFPTGKLVPLFNPNVSPLSPPLKSGITVPSSVPTFNLHGPITTGIQHKVLSTSDTSTITGVPISEVYMVVPVLKNMRVNKNTTVNMIIRRGIIIYNVSNRACFLLVLVAIRRLTGVTRVQRYSSIFAVSVPLQHKFARMLTSSAMRNVS